MPLKGQNIVNCAIDPDCGVGQRYIRYHQRRHKSDFEVYIAIQTQSAARGILNHSSNQRL
jgi:hypothetical protein